MPAAPAARKDDSVGAHAGAGSGTRMLKSALEFAALGAAVSGVVIGASLLAPLVITGAVGAMIAGTVGGGLLASLNVASLTLAGAAVGIHLQREEEAAHAPKLGGGCSTIKGAVSPNVTIEGKSAAVVGSEVGHDRRALKEGSALVYCNGVPLSRIGDAADCKGKVTTGATRTIVGGPPACDSESSSAPNSTAAFSLSDPDTWDWEMLETDLGLASMALGSASIGGRLFGAVRAAGGIRASVALLRTPAGALSAGKAVTSVGSGAAIGAAASAGGTLVGGPVGGLIGGAVSSAIPSGRMVSRFRFKSKVAPVDNVLAKGDPGYDAVDNARLINPPGVEPSAATPLLTSPGGTPAANPTGTPLLAGPVNSTHVTGDPRLAGPNVPRLPAPAAHEAPIASVETAHSPAPAPAEGPPPGAGSEPSTHTPAETGPSAPHEAAPPQETPAEAKPTAKSRSRKAAGSPSKSKSKASPGCSSCTAAKGGLLGDRTKRLGRGSQSWARVSSDKKTVIKRERYYQFMELDAHGKPLPGTDFSKFPPHDRDLRQVLKVRSRELTDHLKKSPMLTDVIVESQQAVHADGRIVKGVSLSPVAEGLPASYFDFRPALSLKAKANTQAFIEEAQAQSGVFSGSKEYQHGVRTWVDVNPANFTFYPDGRVRQWFDPVSNKIIDPGLALASADEPSVWRSDADWKAMAPSQKVIQQRRYAAVDELKGLAPEGPLLDDANALYQQLRIEGHEADARALWGDDGVGGMMEPIRFRDEDGDLNGLDVKFLNGLHGPRIDAFTGRMHELDVVNRVRELGGADASPTIVEMRDNLAARLERVVEAAPDATAPAANCPSCSASSRPTSGASIAHHASDSGLSSDGDSSDSPPFSSSDSPGTDLGGFLGDF